MTFQIGDRVVLAEPYGEFIGNIGTVVKLDYGPIISANERPVVIIFWDHKLSFGHDCGGLAPEGHGWNFFEEDVIRAPDAEDDIEIHPVDLEEVL